MEEKFFLHILTKNLKGNLGKFDSMHRINGFRRTIVKSPRTTIKKM